MDDLLISLLLLLLPVLVGLSIIAWLQPHPLNASSRNTPELVPGCSLSADQFYALVFERLKDVFTESQLPFSSVSFGPRQLYSKRHVFSHRGVYLEIRYGEFSYFVYAVPVGGGLYVTSWLFSKLDAMSRHGILKWFVVWHQMRLTIFQVDLMEVFHGLVSQAVYSVIDELREDQGLRPLEEYERRPVLRGFYAQMRGVAVSPPGGGLVPPVAMVQPLGATQVPAPPIAPAPLTSASASVGEAGADDPIRRQPVQLGQTPGTGTLDDLAPTHD